MEDTLRRSAPSAVLSAPAEQGAENPEARSFVDRIYGHPQRDPGFDFALSPMTTGNDLWKNEHKAIEGS
jgi:hypothetical protein